MGAKIVKCKVKILQPLDGVFAKYQPVVGGIYPGEYSASSDAKAESCVIALRGKRIILRRGEFEILEVSK